ncbi:MAG: hypothetical protein LBD50_03445 [Rickettsiales bacterium]|jgi:hypothetical protein|nr:hypothetical protein [Rickettsiales bacterium]
MKKYYDVFSKKWETIIIKNMRRAIDREYSHDEELRRIVWDSYIINMRNILLIVRKEMQDKKKRGN